MANELKTICDLLEGYDPQKSYEVLSALKGDNGSWQLIIKKIDVEEKDQEGVSNDNQ